MRILVTAGNTLTPIDKVRGITNIFTGRTGAGIAIEAHRRGHDVILLTSHPETVAATDRLAVRTFKTFDDLRNELQTAARSERLYAVIHCAAVSDYQSGGIFAPSPGSRFDEATATWQGSDGPAALADRAAGKVKSDEPELWLRLVRTPKLIDLLRRDWGFRGILVKFKLEVGVEEQELRTIAEQSRRQSEADLMVANTLEGAAEWALLGPVAGGYQRVDRAGLPARLLDAVESSHRERSDG